MIAWGWKAFWAVATEATDARAARARVACMLTDDGGGEEVKEGRERSKSLVARKKE